MHNDNHSLELASSFYIIATYRCIYMYIRLYYEQASISAFILICTSIEVHLMHFEKTESHLIYMCWIRYVFPAYSITLSVYLALD